MAADMTDLRTIAFYLPQFHPIRFNDENWGAGFSDWTNVARARPLFPGHFQPKLPGALGFYDLRCPEVMEEQAEFARAAGVNAFCFYYYRFGSQRVLERPLDEFLAHPEIDISFLYCWANEPWTKAWDGRSDKVLLEQAYDGVAFEGLVADLTRAMGDDRYFNVGGKPVFLVYQIEEVPSARDFVSKLREAMKGKLGKEICVGAVFSHGYKPEMSEWLDFVVQFPPHRMPRTPGVRALLNAEQMNVFDLTRGDYFEPYEAVVDTALRYARDIPKMILGVTPDWDNSPRRPNKAHIVVGSQPKLFSAWVEDAVVLTLENYASAKIPAPMLFVNAWNEWGEGAILEPSLELGSAYLNAFSEGIAGGKRRFAMLGEPVETPSIDDAD